MPAALWLGAKWRNHRFRRLAVELETVLNARRGRTPCVLTRWEGCPAVSYLRSEAGGLATVAR